MRFRRITPVLLAVLIPAAVAVTVMPRVGAAALSQLTGRPSPTKVGEVVPDFELTDSAGQTRKLSTHRGRIVVLEWIDPDCPIVQRLYRSKAMQKAYRDVKAEDKSVVWLAINSTFNSAAAKNQFWVRQYKLTYPILLDPTGAVGRQLDARLTPHMFVIDAEGVLRFHGAIDDNRLGNRRPDETTNHVLAAVRQIGAGEEVTPTEARPYGCAIKYRR